MEIAALVDTVNSLLRVGTMIVTFVIIAVVAAAVLFRCIK